jgi:hypothetical protein
MSQIKSIYTLTPSQLAKWDEIRKDITSEFLENPKTANGHPRIKRDGETFKKIELLYSKRKSALEKLKVDESKAALPKDDLEVVLALTLQHNDYTKDLRTASKIGMINKNLNASYKRLIRKSEAKRGILLDPLTTKELVLDSYLNYYFIRERPRNPEYTMTLDKMDDETVLYITQQIINRIKYIRDITRKHPLKNYIKPLKPMQTPLKAETIDSVIDLFEKKYTKETTLGMPGRNYLYKDIIKNTLERFEKLYNKDTNTFIYPLTSAEQKLKNNIFNYYDIPEPIAVFYTYYILSYIDSYIYNLLTMIRGAIPLGTRDIRLKIDEFSLAFFYNNFSILTHRQLNTLIEHNSITIFKMYLKNGLDPNFMYLIDGKIVPLITVLRKKGEIAKPYIDIVMQHLDFVDPTSSTKGGKKQ